MMVAAIFRRSMPLLPAVLAAIALSAGATHPAEAQTGTSEACQRLANNSGFRRFDLLYPLIGSRCFAEAETLARRMLEENERLNSQDPYEMARRYHLLGNLATIYLEMHRYAEAEPLARRALQGWEQARPSPTLVPAALSDLRLQAADRLARIYLARRRFAEALPLAQRVLAARERASGREHRDTLYYLEGLAETYEGLGRYPEAEPLRRRVLVARERALVQQRCAPLGSITTTALTRIDDCHNLHHDTLAAMNNLARLYGILGRYAEAVPLMRRTLDAHERLSGSEGATTMIAVNNMAVLLIAQGRSAEAEPLLRRLLDVRERRLGPDAPDTLIAVNNLAVALQDQRRFPEAKTLFPPPLP